MNKPKVTSQGIIVWVIMLLIVASMFYALFVAIGNR